MVCKTVTKPVLSGLVILALILGSNTHAQAVAEAAPTAAPVTAPAPTPAAVPVPGPVPVPVPAATPMPVPVPFPTTGSVPVSVPVAAPGPPLAQSQETLSARTLVRLEQLTRELSETVGRVEALEAGVIAQKAENERLIALLDMTRANPSGSVTTAKVTDGTPTVAASDQGAVPPTVPPASDLAMFTPPAPPPLSAAIMLTNAQTALQTGGYQIAEANLSQLVWVHPASPEASEGRWLLGEARYVQGAWGTAAQAYVDYLKVSPQGPRAAEALLRLAGAFRQLGDNRQRCVALAEFKRRAPRPDATLKARADGETARMACPAA